MGFIYRTAHTSASIYHNLQNLVPNQSLDNNVLFYYLVYNLANLKKVCMLIKTLQRKAKIAKNGVHLQNFLFFQLLIAIKF